MMPSFLVPGFLALAFLVVPLALDVVEVDGVLAPLLLLNVLTLFFLRYEDVVAKRLPVPGTLFPDALQSVL